MVLNKESSSYETKYIFVDMYIRYWTLKHKGICGEFRLSKIPGSEAYGCEFIESKSQGRWGYIKNMYSISCYRFMLIMRTLDEQFIKYSLDYIDRKVLFARVNNNWELLISSLENWNKRDNSQSARHRCMNNSKSDFACVKHVVFGTQKQNENDKCFDYFYFSKDKAVSDDLKVILNDPKYSDNAFVKVFKDQFKSME